MWNLSVCPASEPDAASRARSILDEMKASTGCLAVLFLTGGTGGAGCFWAHAFALAWRRFQNSSCDAEAFRRVSLSCFARDASMRASSGSIAASVSGSSGASVGRSARYDFPSSDRIATQISPVSARRFSPPMIISRTTRVSPILRLSGLAIVASPNTSCWW